MDMPSLILLRRKLTALESGYLVGVYEAFELKREAEKLITNYHDMPLPEKERAESLRLAAVQTRGMAA